MYCEQEYRVIMLKPNMRVSFKGFQDVLYMYNNVHVHVTAH